VGLIISKLVNTLVILYLARLFSPHDFGQISYLLTLFTLTTLIGDFGLRQWYQKKIHLFREQSLFQQMLTARLISLILFMAILSVLLFFTQPFSFVVSLVLLLALIPEAFLSVTDVYYLTKKQPKKIAIKKILMSLSIGFSALVFRQHINLTILASTFLISDLFILGWYLPWFLLKNWYLSISQGLKSLKQSAGYALLITTSFAYARGDSLIIEYQLGNSALGIYSVAYRYLEGLSLLPSALAENLFHISAKKRNLDPSQLIKITLVMLLLGLCFSVILFVCANLITVTILGAAYLSSAQIVRILSLVLIFFFINSPLSTVVQSSDYLKAFLPWGIANTLLNLALNIILIPFLGIQAAAWTMLVTEVFGLMINLYFIKRIYRS